MNGKFHKSFVLSKRYALPLIRIISQNPILLIINEREGVAALLQGTGIDNRHIFR